MRILITGVLGLIGSEIAKQLAIGGHVIIGNDDLSHNCVDPHDLPAMPMFTCRVTQLGLFEIALENRHIDLIIHCASPVGHARLTPEAQVAWQIVSDTQAVLDLAVRTGARLITFSSSEVLTYSGETDIRAQYSLGKLTSEAMVLGHPTVDARVVRPYNVTGRKQLADGGFVMARFRDAALKSEPLTVFGDGTQVRYFTHVSDFARFVALLVECWPGQRLWSVFNPANGVSIIELAQLFDNFHSCPEGHHITNAYGTEELNNPAWRDTPERPLDMEHFTECVELGWRPKMTLEDIVRYHLGIATEGDAWIDNWREAIP
jgi:UDP-glucose 4-epimerase